MGNQPIKRRKHIGIYRTILSHHLGLASILDQELPHKSCHRQRSTSAQVVEHITKPWSAFISEGMPYSGSPTIEEDVSRMQLQQASRHMGRGRALSYWQPEAL
jgi:hypothetical protein